MRYVLTIDGISDAAGFRLAALRALALFTGDRDTHPGNLGYRSATECVYGFTGDGRPSPSEEFDDINVSVSVEEN